MNKIISTACLAFIAAAKISEGPCPNHIESNLPIETFTTKPFTGLWFEYVWDKGFDDGMNYKCSMWTVLEDEANYVAFNHLHFGENDGKFAQVEMRWA